MVKKHVLLVEDNEGDILLTTEALEERKIARKISITRDGKEALDFLLKIGKYSHTETPDLILLDINLPKINGLEVLEIIRNTASLRSIHVIILSTSSSIQDREFCKRRADMFITKPEDAYDFERVMNEIENFLLNN